MEKRIFSFSCLPPSVAAGLAPALFGGTRSACPVAVSVILKALSRIEGVLASYGVTSECLLRERHSSLIGVIASFGDMTGSPKGSDRVP